MSIYTNGETWEGCGRVEVCLCACVCVFCILLLFAGQHCCFNRPFFLFIFMVMVALDAIFPVRPFFFSFCSWLWVCVCVCRHRENFRHSSSSSSFGIRWLGPISLAPDIVVVFGVGRWWRWRWCPRTDRGVIKFTLDCFIQTQGNRKAAGFPLQNIATLLQMCYLLGLHGLILDSGARF